jgi:hypothetical protein
MKEREKMTINELITHYLSGSEVLRGKTQGGAPGLTIPVHIERPHPEYSDLIHATAWGQVPLGDVVLLKLCGWYALSPNTYAEVIENFMNCDLSESEIARGKVRSGGRPGATVTIHIDNPPPSQQNYVNAIAWYEVPSGYAIVFSVDKKQYVISLHAPKVIKETVIFSRISS